MFMRIIGGSVLGPELKHRAKVKVLFSGTNKKSTAGQADNRLLVPLDVYVYVIETRGNCANGHIGI
jgi:hypothetical protein